MVEVMIRPADQPGDLGWILQAHGELYAAEYGWGPAFEALVARVVADYATDHDPRYDAAWIATVDGIRAGCVMCVRGDDEGTAKLRLLLLHPSGRGRGLGGALVDHCLDFARSAGYKRMVLWTNDPLVAARHIYLTRGFKLTAEEPHYLFGANLLSQTYELDLTT